MAQLKTDLCRLLESHGFKFVRRTNGGHQLWRHGPSGGTVTIPGSAGDQRALAHLRRNIRHATGGRVDLGTIECPPRKDVQP